MNARSRWILLVVAASCRGQPAEPKPPDFASDFASAAPDLASAPNDLASAPNDLASAPPDLATARDLSPRIVTLCSGVSVDTDGVAPATRALQQCIDATPGGGTLALPAGIYLLDGQVVVSRPITLRTDGSEGSTVNCESLPGGCATLRAAPGFNVTRGFLLVQNTSNVILDHLVLDGNRAARLGSNAAQQCAAGNNVWGFNAVVSQCASCQFTYGVSENALCGTSLEWNGDDARIVGNLFRSNGQNSLTNLWADGLTVGQSDRAQVSDNLFVDNSDVALIVGGARDGSIVDNRIRQETQLAFAGLMLHRFCAPNNGACNSSGDFTGATISGNLVDCTTQLCHFGLQLGPHPWDPTHSVWGGTVTGNTIRNARQGINVDGAGSASAPMRVFGNSSSGSPSSARFLCGSRSTSDYNLDTADSIIDRNGDATAVTTRQWHDCP